MKILKPSQEGDTTLLEAEIITDDVITEARDIIKNHQGLVGGFRADKSAEVVKDYTKEFDTYVLWPQPQGG